MSSDEHDLRVRNLQRRHSLGQVGVDWSKAREPSCIHDKHQPASWCDICQHSAELAEWRTYWDGLLHDPANDPAARS